MTGPNAIDRDGPVVAVRPVPGTPRPYAFPAVAEHRLENGLILVDSYHCSRYNTNTGRLTPQMFREVVGRAVDLAAH